MSVDPLIGTLLAERYRVDRLIGEGAMGRVYQAEHVLMRKRVALKVLHKELTTVPEFVQRFEREARAAARIDHTHVAGATDFGKLADGSVYLVLEFVEGEPLTHLIEQGPIAVRRVLGIGYQVALALEVAHQSGIVHRDLKPDNLLLVDTDDEQDFIKVLDFGIAKVPSDPKEDKRPITQIGMVYGTPEYMAPEQALGQDVDGRADLYALGVILFELLTGRRPYVGPAVGLLGQQLSAPLPKMGQVANVKIPPALEQFVVELLATDPKKRVQSAQSARSQLKALSNAFDEGRLAGTENRAATLLSVSLEDVTSRIEQVAAGLPQPVTRVVKSRVSRSLFAAFFFGSMGVWIALATMENAPPPVPPSPKASLEQKPPSAAPLPEREDREAEAPTVSIDALLDAAREQGRAGLERLAEEYPAEGLVHAELSLNYAKEKKYQDAVDSARVALALDPKLNENRKIAGALYRSAQSADARAATFRLLKGPMGSFGIGIIYDLATTKGLSSSVQSGARKLLSTEEVRSLAAPPLLLLLDLERKPKCDEALVLVKKAATIGDKRALPFLVELKEMTGCGRRKRDDCYPCLRDGDPLDEAIRAIEQRMAGPE